MTNAIVTILRNRTTAVALAGVTVELRDHDTGGLLDSVTTDASGLAVFSETEAGYPGQWYLTADDGTTTYVYSSKAIGQVGPWRAIDFVRFMRLMGDGVIDGLGAELACSADGVGMNIDVQDGGAIGRGLIYYWPVDQSVTLAASDPTNGRIDRIVLRFYGPDTSDADLAGKIVLDKLTGTPDPAPVAPTLTQSDATFWEISLCQVLVDAGVSSIAAGKVTDERSFSAGPLIDSSVTTAKIAADAVTSAKIADANVLFEHIESAAWPVIAIDTQTAPDTTSTTNLVAQGTVAAIVVPVTLPGVTADKWTIYAFGLMNITHSNDGRGHVTVEIDGNESAGESPDAEPDSYTTYKQNHVRTLINGGQTVNCRLRYCGVDSGTSAGSNPMLVVIAKRTA